MEQGKKVDHVLATDVTATSGRLSFTSANGSAGTRVILAMVMQHRLPTIRRELQRISYRVDCRNRTKAVRCKWCRS